MGASERVAALRRARERQARIEAATGRTIRAQASLDRAIEAKAVAIERYEQRVANAEAASAAEIAELVRVCRSAEAAAEILGMPVRELRRIVKEDGERQATSREDVLDRGHAGVLMSVAPDPDPLWDIDQLAAYLNTPSARSIDGGL
ncbi:hypothetical protein AB0L70_06830 [Kribbella sp. NPDC051952]|uniref:hypothetical protein n=1 Tax=Kribbella sp. NPDC051952 TaxID=3154851 RepID=UPI003443F406